MRQQTSILVYLPAKEGNYVVRKKPDGTEEPYAFVSSEEHNGHQVCEVPYRDALDLVRATPWLYYPFYEGMNCLQHHRFTPRKHINPGIAGQVLERPAEMAKGLIDSVDHMPKPKPARVPSDMIFGPEDGQLETPPPGPDAGIKDTSMEPVTRETATPQTMSPTAVPADYQIPATVEELRAKHYDDLRMTLALLTQRPISVITGKKEEVIDELAEYAEKQGRPIDGYEPQQEGQAQGG